MNVSQEFVTIYAINLGVDIGMDKISLGRLDFFYNAAFSPSSDRLHGQFYVTLSIITSHFVIYDSVLYITT